MKRSWCGTYRSFLCTLPHFAVQQNSRLVCRSCPSLRTQIHGCDLFFDDLTVLQCLCFFSSAQRQISERIGRVAGSQSARPPLGGLPFRVWFMKGWGLSLVSFLVFVF